jgi:hypothetical protein
MTRGLIAQAERHTEEFPPEFKNQYSSFIKEWALVQLRSGKKPRYVDLKNEWRQEHERIAEEQQRSQKINASINAIKVSLTNIEKLTDKERNSVLDDAQLIILERLEDKDLAPIMRHDLENLQARIQAISEACGVLTNIRGLPESLSADNRDRAVQLSTQAAGLITRLDPNLDPNLCAAMESANASLLKKLTDFARYENLTPIQRKADELLFTPKFAAVRDERGTRKIIQILTALRHARPVDINELRRIGTVSEKKLQESSGAAGEFYSAIIYLAKNYREPKPMDAAKAALSSVLRPRPLGEKRP